jgi:hypothetical protein
MTTFTIKAWEAISKVVVTGNRDDAGYFANLRDIKLAIDEHMDAVRNKYTVTYSAGDGTYTELCEVTGKTCQCDTLVYTKIKGAN